MFRRLLPFMWVPLCIILGGRLLAQTGAEDARWSVINPASTQLLPSGPSLPYPESLLRSIRQYVNPNTKTRVIYGPAETYVLPPNFRVHPTSISTQSEVPITRHPTNQNIMLASSNAVRITPLFISEGVYVTTDGGTTWFGNDTLNGAPIGLHGGDPGPVIDKNGVFLMSHLGTTMHANYSTDNGITWSPTFTMPGAVSSDKNLSGTDDAPSSPFYGRSYTVWTEFAGAFTNRIVISYTTNSGVTWSAASVVSPPPSSGHHHQGCDVRVGPTGEVYVIWANCTSNGQNSTEDSLGFARSTDGGVTWAYATNSAIDMNGIRALPFGPWGIRVAGFPRIDVDRSGGPRNGWIYVTSCEKIVPPATDAADATCMRSTDGGTTWTKVRANQDTPGSGALQYFSAIRVDESGGVNIVYYDTRNTLTNDSVEVYVSRSLDGGNTWTDIKASDHKFRPAPIAGLAVGYQGDYIGITSGNGRLWPYWADNSSGLYQAWITSIATTENFGWVKGSITNAVGGAPVTGVNVDFTNAIPQVGAVSDPAGFYKAGARVDTPGTTQSVTLRAREFGFRDTLITLTITRNDTITRNIVMSPVASPTIAVSPTSLVFPTTILGTTRRDSAKVRNAGLQTLTLSSVTTTNARFVATATSLSIAYGDSARIRVAYSPLVTGTDTGRVILLTNDPLSPRVDIILNGTAGNHDIGILSFGGSLAAGATIANTGPMAPSQKLQQKGHPRGSDSPIRGNPIDIALSVLPDAPTNVSGDALRNFRALVRNSGAFVESTYQVGWAIDGVAQTPLDNPRPLLINRTDTLVLTWANPVEGAHVARAWTLLGTDANHSNDSSVPYNFNVLPPGVVFLEGFNGNIPPYPAGWHVKNRDGGGTTTWSSGDSSVFPAFEGTGYVAANFQAANGTFIDEWLVTPNTGGLTDAIAVDSLVFWQRSPGDQSTYYPDSIQIRVSTTDTAVASFTTVLDYFRTDTIGWRRKAYPLPVGANRFIAFRYLHYNGGTGPNSNYIGIDNVEIQRTFAATPGWVTQTSGLTTALYSVRTVDPNTGWIGGAGGIVLRSTNSGDSWASVGGGAIGTADVYAIEAVDANTAFVTTSPGGGGSGTFIYRTINAGASWTQVYTNSSTFAFIDAIKMYDANTGIALGDPVGGRWTILRTTDGGATWLHDTTNAPLQVGTEAGSNNGMTTIGTTHVWFTPNGNANNVYRTTNGGTTWASSPLPFTTFTAGIAFCNTQVGVVGGQTGQVARTTNGGATWTLITFPSTGTIYGISAAGSKDLFVASGGNVYRSTDLGVTWTTSLTGTIGTPLWYCSFVTSGSNTRGWVVSGTGGIAAFYGSITSVREDVAGVPTSFAITQNYPNPFNPSTKIRYELPEQATVILKVYNIIGQEVMTLADGPQAPGYYQATWDGRNNYGSVVSSGVYFYRFEANGVSGQRFSSLKKMLILK